MVSEHVMYTAGLVILIAVGLYFAFQAIVGLGLETKKDSGTVVGREHREATMGYRTEIINSQPRPVRHYTPEKYILKLDINGQQTEGTVSRGLFEEVQPGDRLQVTFQKRRLTGRVQILDVTR